MAPLEGIAPLPESGPLADACSAALEAGGSQTASELLAAGAAIGAREPDPDAAVVVELVSASISIGAALVLTPPGDAGDADSPQPQMQSAASLWLLGRAAELAAGLGEYASGLHAEAAVQVARAQMHAFEDLYDPDREPARCLEIARMRTGALFALAIALGRGEGGSDAERAQLARFAQGLGVAEEIAAQIERLETPELAALDLRSGVYGLPAGYALEADPELAAEMDAGLDPDRVAGLISKLGGGEAVQRARDTALAETEAASEELAGLGGTQRAGTIAAEVAERCRRTNLG